MNQKAKTKKIVLFTALAVVAALVLLFLILRFLPGEAVEVIPVSNIHLMWEPDSIVFDGAISSEAYQSVNYFEKAPCGGDPCP